MPQLSFFEQDNIVDLRIAVTLKPNGHGSVAVDHLNQARQGVVHAHRQWAVARDFLGLPDVLHVIGNHFLYGVSQDLPLLVRGAVNEHMPVLPSVGRLEAVRDSL